MSKQIIIKITLCSAFFFLLTSTQLLAQKENEKTLKPDIINKNDLPKLDKAVIGGGAYGKDGTVVDFSKKNTDEKPISEVDVLNRSEADGKMSRLETLLLERARRQPQDR